MQKHIFLPILFGGFIRYFLTFTKWSYFFGDHIEISTPLNSLKRVKEGVYLLQKGIDPYSGDVVHEIPLFLCIFIEVYKYLPQFVPLIYTLLDLLTAYVLHELVQQVVRTKLKEQKLEYGSYAKNTDDLQWQFKDITNISLGVLYMYLFNPLSIMNCVAQVSTVFSNLFLALTLYFLCHHKLIPCLLCLSVETMKNLYPAVLIAPILLTFSKPKNRFASIGIVLLFIGMCLKICALNSYIVKSWSFIDGTLGFIFFYRDLQPNIGLFWYFFTEMFDHFRTMFLITFQMNATVLYLIPLALKLRKEPMLLATVLISLVTIFRSYPCLGDVSLYLALLPLWRRSRKFMAHNFVVLCFFVVTLCMMPVLWHLWIYAGSANANFYFGTTLAFSTGQIFLVTDLLFAYVKRQFCLLNGEKIYIDGKEAKIILE